MSNQDHRSGDAWAFGPTLVRRRSRKPYVSLIAPIAAFMLLLAPAALAADVTAEWADVSADVSAPTDVSIGANAFTIEVWATGNKGTNGTGNVYVTNVYNMATDGTITPGATTTTVTFQPGQYDPNASGTVCGAVDPQQGCESNPFEVAATLNVAAETENGKTGSRQIVAAKDAGSAGSGIEIVSLGTGYVRVVVSSYTLTGFYSPVENRAEPGSPQVVNGVKGGSTVPLKFNIWDGDTAITDTSAVETMVQKSACNGGATDDMLTQDELSSGNTSLRWDGEQFIFNWKTPKQPATCYRVIVTAEGGATLQADFNLK